MRTKYLAKTLLGVLLLAPLPGRSAAYHSVIVQPDGKVLLAGSSFEPNRFSKPHGFARFKPNGRIDPTFDVGFGVNGPVYAMVRQPDGKVLVGGLFSGTGFTRRSKLARFNANGSLDTNFTAGVAGAGYFDGNYSVNALALQSDGKILVGGYFDYPRENLFRLNPNGSVDTGYPFFAGPSEINAIVTAGNQAWIGGGSIINYYSYTPPRVALVKEDGTLDSSFNFDRNGNGFYLREEANAVLPLPGGKILAGSRMANSSYTLVQFNADGTRDESFPIGILGFPNTVHALARQSDGKILVAGNFSTPRHNLLRMNADATVDTSFSASVNGAIHAVALQGDGRILIGGSFSRVGSANRWNFARLNSSGALDPTFEMSLCRFSIVQSNLAFLYKGGTAIFKLDTQDGCSWTAASSSDWITLPRTKGIGPANVSFQIAPNPGFYSRSGTITVEDDVLEILQFGDFFSSAVDNYNGLVLPPIQYDTAEEAFFTLRLNATGQFTGSYSVDGVKHTLNGKFTPDGEATFTMKRKGKSTLTLDLTFDPVSKQISGSVADGITTSSLVGLGGVPARSNSPYAGTYTMLLVNNLEANSLPATVGVATAIVNARGVISLSATLADGTMITRSSLVSPDGRWPLYVPLYNKNGKARGALSGWLDFGPDGQPSGTLKWSKRSSVISARYPGGFTNRVSLAGMKYLVSTNPVLNLTNGMALLFDGGLDVILTNKVTLGATKLGKTKFLPDGGGIDRLLLSATRKSGWVSGSFRHPETAKKSSVFGVIFSQLNAVDGIFLSTNQAGGLLIQSE